jgi:hypothetical protein
MSPCPPGARVGRPTRFLPSASPPCPFPTAAHPHHAPSATAGRADGFPRWGQSRSGLSAEAQARPDLEGAHYARPVRKSQAKQFAEIRIAGKLGNVYNPLRQTLPATVPACSPGAEGRSEWGRWARAVWFAQPQCRDGKHPSCAGCAGRAGRELRGSLDRAADHVAKLARQLR